MTCRLLNAGITPREGTYRVRRLTVQEFVAAVNLAAKNDNLVSYIGYPNAADVLSKLCGIPISLNRATTIVEDGDVLLVARLAYRLDNPALKGQVRATATDYEFFMTEYRDA